MSDLLSTLAAQLEHAAADAGKSSRVQLLRRARDALSCSELRVDMVPRPRQRGHARRTLAHLSSRCSRRCFSSTRRTRCRIAAAPLRARPTRDSDSPAWARDPCRNRLTAAGRYSTSFPIVARAISGLVLMCRPREGAGAVGMCDTPCRLPPMRASDRQPPPAHRRET